MHHQGTGKKGEGDPNLLGQTIHVADRVQFLQGTWATLAHTIRMNKKEKKRKKNTIW